MFTMFCVPAFASETTGNTNDEGASFDLSTKVAQETITTTPDGNTIVYGVEPVIDPDAVQPLASEYPNATGQWKVYFYSGVLNGEYYIDINSNSKITRAYDQWHLFTGYTVANSGLEHTSTTARGWWDLELLGSSWLSARWELRAEMNGTTLKTWVN
ncbi:DUF5626 family protein [Paenibacillus sp. JGP012]|uniref:DUF5626 family protein n=1 Tax=Paenibacillus sp. JGP012 TaxID=2735914 RepID=UPI001C8797D9|nr:DUF5626 family protein [Paenibacillus sp. JGP012]